MKIITILIFLLINNLLIAQTEQISQEDNSQNNKDKLAKLHDEFLNNLDNNTKNIILSKQNDIKTRSENIKKEFYEKNRNHINQLNKIYKEKSLLNQQIKKINDKNKILQLQKKIENLNKKEKQNINYIARNIEQKFELELKNNKIQTQSKSPESLQLKQKMMMKNMMLPLKESLYELRNRLNNSNLSEKDKEEIIQKTKLEYQKQLNNNLNNPQLTPEEKMMIQQQIQMQQKIKNGEIAPPNEILPPPPIIEPITP